MNGPHRLPLRVYYQDTDAGGIVYHAEYLRFAERGRAEWLRALGFPIGRLAEEGVIFAVRRAAIDYVRPARLDDALVVESRLAELSGASLTLSQTVRREADELARLTINLACLDRDGRPRRLPADLRAAMRVAMPP